jgi:hypothetical protein
MRGLIARALISTSVLVPKEFPDPQIIGDRFASSHLFDEQETPAALH